MPATKAPNANDSPLNSVSHAMPSVNNNTLSMNSSEDFCWATKWNQGRNSFCPKMSNADSTTAALSMAMAMVPLRSPSL